MINTNQLLQTPINLVYVGESSYIEFTNSLGNRERLSVNQQVWVTEENFSGFVTDILDGEFVEVTGDDGENRTYSIGALEF